MKRTIKKKNHNETLKIILLVFSILFMLPNAVNASPNYTQEEIKTYKKKAHDALKKYYVSYKYKYYKKYLFYIKKCRIKIDAKLGLKICAHFGKLASKYDRVYKSYRWRVFRTLANKFRDLESKCQRYVKKSTKNDTTDTNTNTPTKPTNTVATPTFSTNNTTTVTNNTSIADDRIVKEMNIQEQKSLTSITALEEQTQNSYTTLNPDETASKQEASSAFKKIYTRFDTVHGIQHVNTSSSFENKSILYQKKLEKSSSAVAGGVERSISAVAGGSL